MDCPTATRKQLVLLERIVEFSQASNGLELELQNQSLLRIRQRVDGHTMYLNASRLQDILMRSDSDGRSFVQVNFEDGLKILITDRLIGFKPVLKRASAGALAKLPRVVTTPDLLSVLEAMEEAVDAADRDLSVLRELFESIVCGAEKVGFDVAKEKAWLLPYLALTPGFRANA